MSDYEGCCRWTSGTSGPKYVELFAGLLKYCGAYQWQLPTKPGNFLQYVQSLLGDIATYQDCCFCLLPFVHLPEADEPKLESKAKAQISKKHWWI